MTEINNQQAKEFLNNISKKDNIAIIHHDDSDGFCSAIIFHDFLISKKATVKTFPYNLSDTSLKNLPLEEFNKIIITDVSTKAIQKEIKSIKHKTIFLTDHHPKFPLPKEILSLLTTDEGYIPSSKTAYELTNKKEWLAMIGSLSDSADLYKENQEYIKDFLKRKNITLKKFQINYVYPFSDTITCLKETPEKIFPILSKIDSLQEIKKLKEYSKRIKGELEKYEKKYEKEKEEFGDISLFQYKAKLSINKPLINIITRKHPEKIHIFLLPKENKINISVRDQTEKVGANTLLEAATKNLPDAKSGGHLRASGAQIRASDLKQFKQNIKNYKTNS